MKMKRGSLPARTIIILVTIIIAFVIILFLYWQFNWRGEIDKEACHQSVVLRATIPTLLERKAVELPLRCRTGKICITSSSNGKCTYIDDNRDEREVFAGEKYEKKVVKSDDEIKKIIADAIYDCWWMMGEGKVDVFSREWELKSYTSSCVLCTRIAFDKKIQDDNPNGIEGISKYLDNTKVSGQDFTYSQFLTAQKEERPYSKFLSEESDTFSVEEQLGQAIIFQEFDRSTWPEDISGGVVGALAAGLVGYFSPVGKVQLSTIAFFGGSYIGRKGGALIGGRLIGEKYLATWAFSPFRAETGEIKTEIVKSVDKTSYDDACFAKISDGNYYGFNKERKFMWGNEEKIFSYTGNDAKGYIVNYDKKADGTERTAEEKIWLDQVQGELTVLCFNLKAFKCDDFASYA